MTNDERVQVRAYFHWENADGSSSGDAVSNWVQAELEEKLLETAQLIQPHICALLCMKKGRTDPEGIVAGGSATFIDTGSARLIVTAEHVVRELFSDEYRALLAAGDGQPPIDITHLRDSVERDAALDLATIRLPDDFDISPLGRRFVSVAGWPRRVAKGEIVVLLGYPGLHREPITGGLRLRLTPFCDFVTSVQEDKFYLVDENLERVAANLSGENLEPFGTTGGLSGSMVFANRDGRLEPVGVLYEGGDGVETMFFVTHADRIGADGKIR